MSRLKIGIDVGGTNTDAVVVDEGGQVIASTKSATTLDPSDGIAKALSEVIAGVDKSKITQAMLGTTHPANAIIQRKKLQVVGVLRLAAPSSLAIRPGAKRFARIRNRTICNCRRGIRIRRARNRTAGRESHS